MAGAMGTRRLSTTVVPREKWTLKSLFYPHFDPSTIEKNVHALLNAVELFLFSSPTTKSKIIHLTLLAFSICLNILSLIIINRLKNRILSNIISFVYLCQLAILSCICPFECHVYLLIVLIYTLANFSLFISILISLIITIIITIFTLKINMRLILLLITNMIGIYLNYLLDITNRSAYDQLCKNANVRDSLLSEHTLISKIIDSLMLRKYAKVIMEDFYVFRECVQNVNISRQGEDDL